MELLEQLPALIEQYSNYVVIGGGFVLELLLRGKKTDKPMSIIRVVARGARSIGAILDAVAGVADKLVVDKTK